MKESIQITKKKNPKLNDILNFLVNGLSKVESRPALKHLNVELYNDVKYAVAADGALALWADVTEFKDLPEGVYSLESTKTSWFLTNDKQLVYPNWKNICLRSNEINPKIEHLDLRTCLDKSSQGYLSCLSGWISPLEARESFSFSPEILDKIHKGSKGFVWEVVHLPEAGSPVRLSCGIFNAMIAPRKNKVER